MSHQPLNSALVSDPSMLVSVPADALGLVLRGVNQGPQLRMPRICQLAVVMKGANSVSEEVWWRCGACMLASLLDRQWCSQCGSSFLSQETVCQEPASPQEVRLSDLVPPAACLHFSGSHVVAPAGEALLR